jgi:hypothetical protein
MVVAANQNLNQNPLIHSQDGDTINEIYDHAEWLELAMSNDDSIHPGLVQSMRLIRQAVGSLKAKNGLISTTQKV